MAEVFGVVASAVALLHLTAKSARILGAIPEIEDDFQDLCDEIKSIDRWVAHANGTVFPTTGFVRDELARSAEGLKKIGQELENIEEKLKKEAKDGTFKVKKAKWLIKSDKISRLFQKTRRAKRDLMSTVQWQQTEHITRIEDSISRGKKELVAARRYIAIMVDRMPPPENDRSHNRNRVEELPDSWGEDDDSQSQALNGASSDDSTNEDRSISAALSSAKSHVDLARPFKRFCPKGCKCSCHTFQRQDASWSGYFLANLGIRLTMPIRSGQSDDKCRCNGAWKMEFFPPWLRARMFILSGSRYTLVSLRAVRVFTYREFRRNIPGSIGKAKKRLLNRRPIYPDDQTESGLSPIQWLLHHRKYDILGFLMTEWKGAIAEAKVARQTVQYAYSQHEHLLEGPHNEVHASLLQAIMSLTDDIIDPLPWKVRRAAETGIGMAEALAEVPAAIDMIDNSGRAALHLAAENDSVSAIRDLVKAGADVHILNSYQQTAIFLAAGNDNMESLRELLLSGCRWDHRNAFGQTLLHYATYFCSINVIRFLLSPSCTYLSTANAKKLASTVDHRPRLPIHELAELLPHHMTEASPEVIAEIAKLLLHAYPEGIDRKTRMGHTPVFCSLRAQNIQVVQPLLKAGGSLTETNIRGEGLLHTAARFADASVLDLVSEQLQLHDGALVGQLGRIDHQRHDKYGVSPWNRFLVVLHEHPGGGFIEYRDDSQGRSYQLNRRPNANTCTSFVNLFRIIRDTYLKREISVLKTALHALQVGEAATATQILQDGASHGVDSQNKHAAGWYRGVIGQINADENSKATDSLEEYLEELADILRSSPWSQNSKLRHEWTRRSQWLEISGTCFWLEPPEAIISRLSLYAHIDSTEGVKAEYAADNRRNSNHGDESEWEDEDEDVDDWEDVSHTELEDDQHGFVPRLSLREEDIDFSKVEFILSDRNELLFSRATDTWSVSAFLDQYR